ncbi:winged helix-turn-helix domain-containing protein [Novosphingobium sp.]|uniref:winged helix-turn-helix domain-containing protein n=1 Tax=Novosphingobium sp. TaxID=1874826 RepID=UPI0025E09E5F|nr:winged helix-turn-helix domain-containing protein [Novosphingobium sp.]
MRDHGRIDLASTPPFRIGPLCVEPAVRQVSTAATEPETLEPRVMLVLVALARVEGGIVSRDQLIEQCWDSRIVGDDSINRVISRLRKLAGAHGEALFTIETISKVGYRLVAKLVNAAEPGRSVEAAPIAGAIPAIVTRSLLARPLMIAATAALAIGAVAAGISLWPASAASDGVPELALNVTAGPGTAPGVAQALRDEMGSVYGAERLRIVDGSQQVARLSARIGNMGGEQVVFGELRPRGDGPAIWKPRVPLRDPGAIKGVALQLMGGAVCVLEPEVTHAPVNRSPVAVSAWASYCDENDKDISSHITEIESLRLAIRAEPRFMIAQYSLGQELAAEIDGRSGAEVDAMRAEGRRAVDAAEQLNPRDAGVHIARAYLADERDFAGRDAEVRRARASRPTKWGFEIQLEGNVLATVGKLSAALAAHQRMLAVNPGNPPDTTRSAILLSWSGRYDEGRAIFADEARISNERSKIELTWLRAAVEAHDWDTAKRLVNSVKLDQPTQVAMAKLVTGLAMRDAASVHEAGDLFAALSADPARFSNTLIFGLALADRPALAVATAGRWFDANGYRTLTVLYSPALARARQTPEFAALVTRIGLADYWRKSGNLPDFCVSPGAPPLCATLRRRT